MFASDHQRQYPVILLQFQLVPSVLFAFIRVILDVVSELNLFRKHWLSEEETRVQSEVFQEVTKNGVLVEEKR